jgi:hypothetical protein
MTTPSTSTNAFFQDPWVHIAALIAVAIGFSGWYQTGLNHDPSSVELMFMIGGLAGLGVKIVNGSATTLAANTAANVVAQATQAATTAVEAAAVKAAAVTDTASVKAADILTLAARTAADLPPSAPGPPTG